jgi:hypothetical protein
MLFFGGFGAFGGVGGVGGVGATCASTMPRVLVVGQKPRPASGPASARVNALPKIRPPASIDGMAMENKRLMA